MARAIAALVAAGWMASLLVAPGRIQAAGAGQQPASAVRTPSATPDRSLITTYCVTCHNPRLKTAGLVLDGMDPADPGQHADVWEKVVRKLRTGAMPPTGRPRPDRDASAAFVANIESALDNAAAAHPNPGRRPAVHRLNRAEYTNAIRDLLALDIDGPSLLPADDADANGFDNMADVLSTSPAFLQRYIAAGRKISRLAIGTASGVAGGEIQHVSKLLYQDERMSESLPFGSRGGVAMRHLFPVDGEYSLTIRLQRNVYGFIRGLAEAHDLDVWLDGERVTGFTVGGEKRGAPPPLSYAGNIRGTGDWDGFYTQADSGLEVRFAAKSGTRVVGVAFRREEVAPEGVLQPRQVGWGLAIDDKFDSLPAVETVEIAGPYQKAGAGDTPSRQRVFVCRPGPRAPEESCAKRVLSTLARRAYRRPVSDKDVEPLLEFFRSARSEGDFDAGIQAALEVILADPEFLFRIERDPSNIPPGSIYRVSDLELASRLSFFLWSSIPDDELLDVAARGRLKDPAVLDHQVRRMLADARAKSLVDNFAGQWLLLRNVQTFAPDPDTFPDFDDNLRDAFQRETELFFESQLREDHSLLDLLSANYTFVNERLARHYGIRGVYGSHFRRVTLNAGEHRVGLLGQGSLLMVTSYPDRTSPVVRGKWLLENVFGAPPPPPPENVPALKDKGENGQAQSVRERLEIHRKNPACASCHARMDPLGFALENFDGIGTWRTMSEANTPIDASSALPDGTRIDGADGLRKLLLDHGEDFVATVVEKLLTYALGRPVVYYDLPAVRRMIHDSAPRYRWSSIVLGIVKSTPFQMRRSAS